MSARPERTMQEFHYNLFITHNLPVRSVMLFPGGVS